MIKSISKFLAGAALSSFAVTAVAHQGNLSLDQIGLNKASQPAHVMSVSNLAGEQVKISVPDVISPETFQAGSPGNTDHYHVINHYQGEKICSILLDGDQISNKNIGKDNHLLKVVDTNSYLYSLVSHEVAHCIGVTEEIQKDLVSEILANPQFSGYEDQAVALASSMGEVHADLTASLMGASKTGDWSVFNKYVLHERTNGFSPDASTVLAVVDLIRGIDPQGLKGLNANEVLNLSNAVFVMNAYSDGKLSPSSRVAGNILAEWKANKHEAKVAFENLPPEEANILGASRMAKDGKFYEFSDKFHNNAVSDKAAINLYFGVKSHAIDEQSRIIANTTHMNEDQRSTIQRFKSVVNNNFKRAANIKEVKFEKEGFGIDVVKRAINKSLNTHNNPEASRELAAALPTLLQETFSPLVLGDQYLSSQKNLNNILAAIKKGDLDVTASAKPTFFSKHQGLKQIITIDSEAQDVAFGSAIQFNEHFVATNEHVPLLDKDGVTCKKKCDLQFYAQEAKGPVPEWRNGIPGETARVVGSTYNNGFINSFGSVLDAKFKIDGDVIEYGLIDAHAEPGMSGGPVYGADGKVIGVTKGFIKREYMPELFEKYNATYLTLFIPTSEVQEQYQKLNLEKKIETTVAYR